MTPAFGFSVGDFIGAIELCSKVANALKPIGGASSSFQDLTLELHSLETVLQRLAALEPNESNINHVNAIRCMALACRFPLRQFLDKIGPYESYLGSYGESSLRAAGKKAKWAVFVDEEIKKLRVVVSAKVVSINMLLALHASEALSRLEQNSKTRQDILLAQMRDQEQSIQKVADESSRIREDVRDYRRQTGDETRNLETGVYSRFDTLDSQAMNVTRKLSSLSVETASNTRSLISLRSLGTQMMDFIRSFPVEIRGLLQNVIQGNLQNFHTLLAIQSSISASPSLLNSSNIRFEDGLGVVRSLPFEWFRYWEPFHGLLQSQFVDTPGQTKVLNGEFCLVPARRSGTTITKEQWTRNIQPGADILMLMLMTHVTWNGLKCPRPTCTGRPSIEASVNQIVTCPDCGLRYSSSVSDVTEINMLQDKLVIREQLQDDEKMFGARTAPLEPSEVDAEMPEAPAPIGDSSIVVTSINRSTTGQSLEVTGDGPSLPEESLAPTPLLKWLDRVVRPNEPLRDMSATSDVEEQKRSGFQLETEEIEYFKNIRVNPTVTDADAPPLSDDPREPDLDFGARVYYRNITDRYPEMAPYLAVRLAEANWDRAKRLEAAKRISSSVTAASKAPAYDQLNPDRKIHGVRKKQLTTACDSCRLLKIRCDGKEPCWYCIETNRTCIYSPKERSKRKEPIHEQHSTIAQFSAAELHQRFPLARRTSFDDALQQIEKSQKTRSYGRSFDADLSNLQNPLHSTHVRGPELEYWTGATQPARPSSRVSSRNSSLYGYQVFDPEDQNMAPATIPRRGSSQSVGDWDRRSASRPPSPMQMQWSTALPPPPAGLGTVESIECDICGKMLEIRKKRHWKRHVMQDLRPYICHAEGCRSPDETFSRRQDLLQHYRSHEDDSSDSCLSILKKGSWYECTACDGRFLDSVTLGTHQRRYHRSSPTPATAYLSGETVAEGSSRKEHFSEVPLPFRCDHLRGSSAPSCRLSGKPHACGRLDLQAMEQDHFDPSYVRFVGPSCPFCHIGLAPGERLMTRHLGRHMEEIAFAVVKRPHEEWNFYQDTSSEMSYPLSYQDLFRLLQSNAELHGQRTYKFAGLADPPDLYSSLTVEQSAPPEADIKSSDPDMIPYKQDLRFNGDLYTPLWVRGHGNKREGWCGLCKPGRWLVQKNSAYWYDKSFTHGVSAATGGPFQKPQDMRRMDGNPDVWEGLCESCGEWIALVSSKKKGTTWFRHAYKCHTHPKVARG